MLDSSTHVTSNPPENRSIEAPVAVIATSMTLSKERYLRTFDAVPRPLPALSQMLLIRALINFTFCCVSCTVCLVAAALVGRSISVSDVVLVLAAAWSGCVIGLLTGVAGLIVNDVFSCQIWGYPHHARQRCDLHVVDPVSPNGKRHQGPPGNNQHASRLTGELTVTLVFFMIATAVASIAQDRASAGQFGN